MITDPMAILGDMRRDDRDEIIRQGFAAEVTLGVVAACIVAAVGTIFLIVGQHTFGVGLLAVAPWLLALDLQDYWRQIGFMQGNPKKSLMNDLVFNAVQAMAFGAIFLAGSALGVRRHLGLGRGSCDRCSLRSSAVLSTPVATRGRGVSPVPLADEPVAGQ